MLNDEEKQLLEAFQSMLDSGIGLTKPAQPERDIQERGLEYLHNQIDEMFHHKTADLNHHTGICAAFAKVHSYRYIDNKDFMSALMKELSGQGIPIDEADKVKDIVKNIMEQLHSEQKIWSEADAGWGDIKELEDASFPDTTQDVE